VGKCWQLQLPSSCLPQPSWALSSPLAQLEAEGERERSTAHTRHTLRLVSFVLLNCFALQLLYFFCRDQSQLRYKLEWEHLVTTKYYYLLLCTIQQGMLCPSHLPCGPMWPGSRHLRSSSNTIDFANEEILAWAKQLFNSKYAQKPLIQWGNTRIHIHLTNRTFLCLWTQQPFQKKSKTMLKQIQLVTDVVKHVIKNDVRICSLH
jgi:hypothetical protein